MKRKLVISSYDDKNNPYYAGGGSCSIHEIARRLTDDYEVTVFTANYYGATDKIVDGVIYKRIGPTFLGPRVGQLLWHFILPLMVVRTDFDIWLESFTPPFSTSFLPLFTRKPVVGLVHMLSADDMRRKYKLPFNLIENFGLKFYKFVIALTENTKRKILEKNEEARVFVVANGVNLPSKKNRSNEHILFLGRVEMDQKGLDILLEAIKSVEDKLRLPLIIAGSGAKHQVEHLRKFIKKLGLEKRVKYVGKVKGKRKSELFENASFLVLTSRYETFSLVSLEAFSYGLPVVCFDIGGLSWFDNKHAIKVKPFDKMAFAQQILKLQSDPELRRKMGKKGKILALDYSWDALAKKYKKVLSIVEKYEQDNKMMKKLISV
jgi:glycosyltransferase involved in cell wall biosynthesis